LAHYGRETQRFWLHRVPKTATGVDRRINLTFRRMIRSNRPCDRKGYADKDIEDCIIRRSRLDWTIVHPTILTNGPRTEPIACCSIGAIVKLTRAFCARRQP